MFHQFNNFMQWKRLQIISGFNYFGFLIKQIKIKILNIGQTTLHSSPLLLLATLINL